jgi:hypothetical protein
MEIISLQNPFKIVAYSNYFKMWTRIEINHPLIKFINRWLMMKCRETLIYSIILIRTIRKMNIKNWVMSLFMIMILLRHWHIKKNLSSLKIKNSKHKLLHFKECKKRLLKIYNMNTKFNKIKKKFIKMK